MAAQSQSFIDVGLGSLVRNVVVNVRVTGMRAFAWRTTIGAKIMGFGIKVMGAKAKVEISIE